MSIEPESASESLEKTREELKTRIASFEKEVLKGQEAQVEVIVFRYDKERKKLWGFKSGVFPLEEDKMNIWRKQGLHNGEIGVSASDSSGVTDYQALLKFKDPRVLAGNQYFNGVGATVRFIDSERGPVGHIDLKKGSYYRTNYVPDRSWQMYGPEPVSGDRYKVLTVNLAGNKNGVHFCLPVECVFSQRDADLEYAKQREEALARGNRLIRWASDNVHGGTFIDDYTGQEIAYKDPDAIKAHAVKTQELFRSGKSYPGLFMGQDLLEIPEADYQKLREVRDRFDKVAAQIEELIKRASAMEGTSKEGTDEFKDLTKEARRIAKENDVSEFLSSIALKYGNMVWNL